MTIQPSNTLYYIHDPMCSWCWGFNRTWSSVEASLAGKLKIEYVVAGLAPDSDQPMPEAMQTMLQNTWRTIQQRIPGTEFNFEFWTNCSPRRSTYPACRAVIAAKQQGAELAMVGAIQKTYYLQAKNPSDLSTLEQLAEDIGLNQRQFCEDIRSDKVQTALLENIALGQSLGAQGFPSLVLATDSENRLLELDYNSAERMLAQIL